jgi:hypothetical protein
MRQARSRSERGAVQLPGDERLRVTHLEHPQRFLRAGTLELLGQEAGLLADLEQLPAAPRALGRERPPLLTCLPKHPHR